MIRRRDFLALSAAAGCAAPGALRAGLTLAPPAAGSEGLPQVPRIVNLAGMGRTPGQRGGTLTTIIGGQRDIRLMTVNGYARLVGYDEFLTVRPDILEWFEEIEDRVFTFRIRAGHRWSDGHPFTSEDFRYCWQDVLKNKKLRKGGPPSELMAGGKEPVFEVIDDLTVRYTWEDPNPDFLPRLAAAQPTVIAMPSHYLRQFHNDYQDEAKLDELVKANEVEDWKDLHAKMSRSYRPENPELPMLDPWVNTIAPPAEQFTFVRNPYFHRADENGVQLPYIDKVILNVSSSGIISAKTGAGESDLQMTGLDFVDYPYLKAAEKSHPVRLVTWKRTQGARIALYPNLNCADPVWQGLMRDVRVRRALSLALDRHEVNMVSFFGLATESADTVLPESPLYQPEYASAWAIRDLAAANALLDEAGLADRRFDGIRLLPNGEPFQIVVESAGESTLETDVLELIRDHWREAGVALFTRVSQRDLFRSRAKSGDVVMSIWQGLDNGVPTADMSPAALAPTLDDQLAWPQWGVHYYSRGEEGAPPDMPEGQELLDLYLAWTRTETTAEREAVWHKMLKLHADQVFSIGIINSTLQPIVHTRRLRNLPADGLYGFDPTSYLGVYLPDTFWLDEAT
ncbi:MAG: ABC transporter substrate-binding protein [Paracoccaceae bacterium]